MTLQVPHLLGASFFSVLDVIHERLIEKSPVLQNNRDIFPDALPSYSEHILTVYQHAPCPHTIQSEHSWVRICTIVTIIDVHASVSAHASMGALLYHHHIYGCTGTPPDCSTHKIIVQNPAKFLPYAKIVNNHPYIIPESDAMHLVSSLPIVLFPLPLAPTIPTVDPAGTLRLSPHNTWSLCPLPSFEYPKWTSLSSKAPPSSFRGLASASSCRHLRHEVGYLWMLICTKLSPAVSAFSRGAS